MENLNGYIESGILEMYVLGNTTAEENLEIEKLALQHVEIHNEIELISIALEKYADATAIKPPVTVKPFLLATIDYTVRMQSGEQPGFPPIINEKSNIEEYKEWLDRKDLEPENTSYDIFARIIGFTPKATTAIIWLKGEVPPETHIDEHEKYMVIEGSCEIIIDEKEVYKLEAGDIFNIPLFKSHRVCVTSTIPCKLILQRVAA